MDIESKSLINEYAGGEGYKYRWKIYEYVDDDIKDFHKAAIERMNLDRNDSILDVGCGQGEVLSKIKKLGHTGLLVGLDYNDTLSDANLGAHYIRGNASLEDKHNSVKENKLDSYFPFADNSFDKVLALFMLYHVRSPRATIRDLQRILKPGGRLFIATSGKNNKKNHRKFERMVADDLGIDPPPIFNLTFTSEYAEELLPQLFETVEPVIDQNTTVTITEDLLLDYSDDPVNDQDNLLNLKTITMAIIRENEIVELNEQPGLNVFIAYKNSIKKTMYALRTKHRYRPEYVSYTRRIDAAVDSIVERQIKEAIIKEGAFQERVHRQLYVCSNPK